MLTSQLTLSLPNWVNDFVQARGERFPALEARMQLAIDLARENVTRSMGGPFGAAIFERDTGRLVAVGVNGVVSQNCLAAHAELMALMLAQQKLRTFDLGAASFPAHELVTSAQMCAMCYGATCWAGVRRVVIGATARDTEELTGFDEGPIPTDWEAQLERRGIVVVQGVLREQAREVLQLYGETGGVIYNGRSGA